MENKHSQQHLDIVFALILGLIIAIVLASTVGIILGARLAFITRINVSILIPIIAVICLVGVFVASGNIINVWISLLFGFLGYGMMKYGFSTVTLVKGYILGGLIEISFHQSVAMAWGSYSIFFTRPISLALFSLVILTLSSPLLRALWRKRLKVK